MSSIGDYLKGIREQKKISTIEAQKLSNGNISQSYIVQVENGQKTPSVEKLAAFAGVYGISLHNLVDVMIESKGKSTAAPFVTSAAEVKLIKKIRELSTEKKKAIFTLFDLPI